MLCKGERSALNNTGETNTYKLSIALVTRNRSESLARTLESLSKQAPQPYEVIISDDSNISDCITLNQELARKFNCKYIKGPGRGLYANRNFVARHCRGTHFRTMDDDHEFPEGHLKECIDAINRDSKAIWTIGEICPLYYELDSAPGIPGQLHPRGFAYLPKVNQQYYGISCGGTIYPRSVIDNNILNFEIYSFGILYLEYGARLSKKGYSIKKLGTTYIIHHYDENNRSISANNILSGAKVFSMMMFSFSHKRTIKNQMLTIFQIASDLIKRNYSISLVAQAYKEYRKAILEV